MRGWVDMLPLRRRLRRAGFDPHQFSYPSLTATVEENADRLWQFMQALGDQPLHTVAHSLGGLVTLTAIKRHGAGPVRRIVTLGSPLTGSHVAIALQQRPMLNHLLGRSSRGLVHGAEPLPKGIEIGSIAGTHNLGLGALFARDGQAGDGSVSVAETRPPGLKDHIALPLSHTGLQWSAAAARQTIAFLRSGLFDR